MKKINVLAMMATVLLTLNVFGQLQVEKSDDYRVQLDTVAIAYSKTTNIVFPYSIKSVDRGSEDVLVQKAKNVENILQIKAAKYDFAETNLTVVTSDGQLYSFVLHYDEQQPLLNLVVPKSRYSMQENFTSDETKNEEELQSYAELSFFEKRKLPGVKDKKYEIKLQLNGLFIHENVMYYRIKIENHSNINYDISQLRFFIRDQKKAKRTASQEIEISPLYTYNKTETIEGKSEVCFVFALTKFTIPDEKHLAIQLMEDEGGRHLELHMKNKKMKQIAVLSIL
ncbi:conjugative transposon protein TraN [Flavobacterium sp.]|uniref:conjugative transposon protein TraN n=1 Tax=Flavobacterium sp. TaxID=239 RepID=UPI003C497571